MKKKFAIAVMVFLFLSLVVPVRADTVPGSPDTGFDPGTGLDSHLALNISVRAIAVQTDGKVNILSSPSITTIDNQKAIIESGDEVPYQTVENGEVKIEYKKAVLSLEVTPHVIGNNALKLEINTKKDQLAFANSVSSNSATSAPRINP